MEGTVQSGGLYVILFLNPVEGACHWGFYLHYNTRFVITRYSNQQVVHEGHKYHVKNLSQGWIADHLPTNGVFKSAFLVGLLQVGSIPRTQNDFQRVDTIMRSFDKVLNDHASGNTEYCRVWTIGILRRLVEQGLLQPLWNYSEAAFIQEVEALGRNEWHAAADNDQPRPIRRSAWFTL